MTSLQHHSHHVNHHNTPSSSSNSTNIVSNTPLNNSTSNLSPVIQRKIDSQQLFLTNNNNLQPPLFNQRYSSGSVGAGGAGAVGGIDFDTTSIASVSESSHWSGGGGDDLDNIALVNGSDTNTMENKAWSDFINSKNGYNSSEDDNEYDEDGINNDDSISTSSSTRTKLKTIDDSNSFKKSKKTSSANLINNNNIRKKSNDIIIKSKKVNKENEIDSTSNEQQANNNKTKNKRHNNLINNTNNNNSISIATSNDEITDKKLPKKVSQDSLKSSAHIINNESSKLQDENKNLEDEDQLSTSTKHQNQDIQDDNEFIDDDDEEEEDDEEEDNEYNDFDEDDDEDNDDDEDDDDDDDLDDDDIWTIKPKLYSYYEKQFKIMQPNLNGFITGSVAKPFFERSRLPLNELSKIWELSDVTRDGALSFAEFCTAMHLVVLRVRNYDLPSELPAKLQPYAPLIDFNSETMGENANKINDESMHNLSDNEDLTLSSPTQSSTRFFNTGQKNNSDKPLVFSIKPQIPSDVQIVHPVALRYNNVSNISNQHYQQQQQILTNYQQTNSNEIYSKTNDATLNSTSISPASSNLIPEPPPRHSRSSSLVNINTPTVINTLSTMSNQTVIMTPKILQQQPVVPPRITSPPPAFQQQQHQQQIYYHNQENESSNLNATIMLQQQHAAALASNALLPPPPPPPPLPHHHNLHHYQQQTRLQQQQNLIHNPIPAVVSPTQFSIRAPPPIPGSFVNQTITINQNVIPSSSNPDDINKTIEKLIEQLNVFNLEKLKKSSDSKQQQQQQQIGTSSSTSSTNSIERDVLTSSIRTQTEQNQLLKRLFNELEKELRSLTDTRIALEIKLDFLNTATVSSNVVNNNNNNNISSSGSSVTTTNTNSNVNTNQSIVTSISQQQVNNITQTPTTKQSIQKILPNTPASTVSIATSNSNMTPSYSSTTNSLSSSNNNNNNNNNNSNLTTPVTTVNNTLIANPSNKI